MKNFLVFILILVSKSLFACGFYPYGEELRFSFFNPEIAGYRSYAEFYYSANSFEPKSVYGDFDKMPNEVLWVNYCKNKVSYKSVQEVLQSLSLGDINSGTNNEMLRYLYKIKDYEAINYLKFAKNCEFFNSWVDDPWERNEAMTLTQRTKFLNQAIRLSKSTNNKALQFRYIFLAIRMAFYNHEFEKIKTLFETNYQTKLDKDILYYWSLYFRTLAETDKALANFYAAQVFVNAPDKRFMVSQQYNNEVAIEEVLKYAKTNKEKANVYLLAAIRKHDKSLAYIKKVYEYQPNFEGLSFLLLREVNKIEDWVFTPYYSLFEPSITTNNYWESEIDNASDVFKRIETDRVYASELLAFINNANLTTVENPTFWKSCKAYLHYITKDYDASLTLLEELKSSKNSELFSNQLEIIKALALNARQEYGKAIILNEIKPIILKNKGFRKFIFSLGKELEYKGNTSDAALLYSTLNNHTFNENHDFYNTIYWKSNKNSGDTYSDFYTDYFDYINAVYTPEQLEVLIQNIYRNRDKEDEFSSFKYSILKTEIPRLYDLLGTKYIRLNKLTKALYSFKKVDSKLWNDKYSNWERNGSGWSYGSNVFDKNPFYELKYTPDFIPIKDTIRLNKYTITKQLIKYINKAENPKEKNKDYYYFLVANCYYNMTQYGNSWMMRRYYWTSDGDSSTMVDENEFYQCNSAKTYYLLALKNAKTAKFKALCLRMIGRCEKYRLHNLNEDSYKGDYDDYEKFVFGKNKYYQDLKSQYPEYYKDLTSDCTFFEDYFRARR
ncbi:hypothetical protein ACSVH2_07330 [Flavobacterium sp. RSB2_4_14]|uniref:hypothetical protein n=1 Tax=Flavobacterium sp. RSB2_4_14 TaxID=3447665 RepID=UPI003F2A359B